MKYPNHKRKVQAQRKFAQGAVIPPSSNAVAPVKTDAPTPAKDERRSIIHSNLSAKSLLDIVSFQSIHTHSDPVVVLERLTPTAENSAPVPSRLEPAKQLAHLKIHSKTNPRSAPNKVTRTMKKVKIIKNLKPTKVRRRLKMKYTMLLRSRENSLRKERSSTSDLEDDRPLKYLKLMRVDPHPAPAPSPPVTPPERRRKTAKKQSPDKDGGRITRSAKHQEQHTNTKKEPNGVSPKKGLAVASTSKESTTNETAKNKDLPLEPTIQVQKETTTAKVPQSPGKTFKEPALPARFTRPNPDNKNKSVAEASTSKKASGSRQTTAIAGPSKKSAPEKGENGKRAANRQQYYGDTGIKRWLNSNKGGKGAEADKSKTKVAEKTVREEVAEASESDSRAPSPCPSESLVTFTDVLSASRTVLNRRCNQCPHCKRVNTAEQISTLMQRSRAPKDKPNDNVYDFDPDEETTSNPKPFVFNRKRKAPPQTAEKEQNAAGSSDADDSEPMRLYFDLQKDSPHIIEMTLVKIPNSNKKMMKARLMPKSETSAVEELSLVEHEIMLDEMLQVLQVNNNADENSEANATQASTPAPSDSPTPSTSAERPTHSAAEVPTASAAPKKTRRTKGAAANQEPDAPSEKPEKKEKPAKLLDAPIYRPTEAEFNDPIAFFEKIAPLAAKYGLCKVVAPEAFKPQCILNDALKFNVTNHYISRLFCRWGAAAREITAMRAYLATQNINFNRVPLLDGLEVNLPKLYSVVQHYGGLQQVMGKQLWSKVAEDMRFSKGPNTEKILDNYYMKYLLPYDTASGKERADIMIEVEKSWNLKNRKLVNWSARPLHQAKKLLGEAESSDEEPADESVAGRALHEAEDCIVAGRPMQLSGFKKVAANAMTMYMGKTDATAEEIEKEYWRLVLLSTEHVCVNAASIDTAASGYGFSKTRSDPEWKHPWNLKVGLVQVFSRYIQHYDREGVLEAHATQHRACVCKRRVHRHRRVRLRLLQDTLRSRVEAPVEP
ncbi:hypothetical protein O0L34_g2333 [Tuta absoluta]|nr:hypothetical protein O0L34_g2333 [Tuta absoluta]